MAGWIKTIQSNLLVADASLSPKRSTIAGRDGASYYAVFDGHGGALAAE